MVAVSSCVTGIRCRYNATDSYAPSLLESIGGGYIAICPEILAGFGTPREPCEIKGGSGEDVLTGTAVIVDKNGVDITGQMLRGSDRALRICLENGVTKAYLQARSPTCGCGKIYDGSFSGTLRQGNGVFTASLLRHGIEVAEV